MPMLPLLPSWWCCCSSFSCICSWSCSCCCPLCCCLLDGRCGYSNVHESCHLGVSLSFFCSPFSLFFWRHLIFASSSSLVDRRLGLVGPYRPLGRPRENHRPGTHQHSVVGRALNEKIPSTLALIHFPIPFSRSWNIKSLPRNWLLPDCIAGPAPGQWRIACDASYTPPLTDRRRHRPLPIRIQSELATVEWVSTAREYQQRVIRSLPVNKLAKDYELNERRPEVSTEFCRLSFKRICFKGFIAPSPQMNAQIPVSLRHFSMHRPAAVAVWNWPGGVSLFLFYWFNFKLVQSCP